MVIERARLRSLAWADASAVKALAKEALGARTSRSAAWRQPGWPPLCSAAGFNLVFGADVVYVAEAVPALFAAAAALLSASQEARSHGARCISNRQMPSVLCLLCLSRHVPCVMRGLWLCTLHLNLKLMACTCRRG